MNAQPPASDASTSPPGEAFPWSSVGFWLPPALIHAVAVAYLAAVLERSFAPFLLFPLAVGVALGVGVAALAHWCGVDERRVLVAGTVCVVLVAAVGQHYFAYRHFADEAARRAKALSEYSGLAEQFGQSEPQSFAEFLAAAADRGRLLPGGYRARGAAAWLSWLCDALLVLAGALGVVWAASRRKARSPARHESP